MQIFIGVFFPHKLPCQAAQGSSRAAPDRLLLLLGASAATNTTTDIRAGTAPWEPRTWQPNKGHLWSTLIRTACAEPPCCGCISPQSHLLPWPGTITAKPLDSMSFEAFSNMNDSLTPWNLTAAKQHKHKAYTLCSFSVRVALFVFIVTIWEKRPLGDLNAKYNIFIQSLLLHVLLPWDSNFRRWSSLDRPPKALSCWTGTKAGALVISNGSCPQLFSPRMLQEALVTSYMSPVAPACSLVLYWEKRRVIASKYSVSRPWAIFISWEVGKRRPRSFPKQGDNTRKIWTSYILNFVNEKKNLNFLSSLKPSLNSSRSVYYGTLTLTLEIISSFCRVCSHSRRQGKKTIHTAIKTREEDRAGRDGNAGCRSQRRSTWLQGASGHQTFDVAVSTAHSTGSGTGQSSAHHQCWHFSSTATASSFSHTPGTAGGWWMNKYNSLKVPTQDLCSCWQQMHTPKTKKNLSSLFPSTWVQ